MFSFANKKSGFIRTIILIVIALLALSYFGFNLREIADSPTTKSNFGFVKEVIVKVWENYLKKPAAFVWETFERLFSLLSFANTHIFVNTNPQMNVSTVDIPTAMRS